MPTYAPNQAVSLYPNDSGYAFGSRSPYKGVADTGETVTTGQKSQAFALAAGMTPFMGAPEQLVVNLDFYNSSGVAGAPGTFSFQLQVAETDQESSYVDQGSAIAAVSTPSTTTARQELDTVKAKFARLRVVTQPTNAVTVIAKLDR